MTLGTMAGGPGATLYEECGRDGKHPIERLKAQARRGSLQARRALALYEERGHVVMEWNEDGSLRSASPIGETRARRRWELDSRTRPARRSWELH